MKRIIQTLVLVSIFYPTAVHADTSGQSEGNPPATISGNPVDPADPAWPEFLWQIDHGAPGIPYWERVAKCETRSDWKDHGTWAGGLGIYTAKRFAQEGSGTWERYGGEQFGLRPQDATALQQIVVANRIAMFGYSATYRDWNGYHERVVQKTQWKRPSGFNGWGCIKAHRHGRLKHQWNINLNPTRFEKARTRYWRTHQPPYMVHQVTLPRMNIPGWAWAKIPHKYLR